MFPICLVWFLMQVNVSGCNFAFWQGTGWGAIVANQGGFIAPSPSSLAHVGGGETVAPLYQGTPSPPNVGSTPTGGHGHSDHESQRGAEHEHQGDED